METSQECYVLFWTSPGSNTTQNSNCMATCLPISQTILQVKWIGHAGHCLAGEDKLISNIFSWVPTHRCTSDGQSTRTYIHQLCEDTGCSLEDLLRAMDDRDRWWERVRELHAISTWWWFLSNIDNSKTHLLDS